MIQVHTSSEGLMMTNTHDKCLSSCGPHAEGGLSTELSKGPPDEKGTGITKSLSLLENKRIQRRSGEKVLGVDEIKIQSLASTTLEVLRKTR